MRANPFPAKDAFFGKWFNMISCWKFDHVYRIWLSNPDLLDVMEWKKVVLNCFRKWKSFSFKVDLPLHSTEIGFGRGRLDVKSNWIYVLFSKVFIFFHYSTYSIILAQSLSCYQRGVEENTIKSGCLLKIPLWPCELPFAFHPGWHLSNLHRPLEDWRKILNANFWFPNISEICIIWLGGGNVGWWHQL